MQATYGNNETIAFDYNAITDIQVKRLTKKYVNIVELGAFTGAYLNRAIQTFSDKNLKIYAVEPQSKAYEKLEAAFGDDDRVCLINKGVSSRTGDTLFLYSDDESEASQSATQIRQGEYETHSYMETLSFVDLCKSIPGRINLLRMNIEGGEYSIFRDTEFTDLDYCLSKIDILDIAIHGKYPIYLTSEYFNLRVEINKILKERFTLLFGKLLEPGQKQTAEHIRQIWINNEAKS